LIYQRGLPPEATYQFKHALVQDASYASLVRSRRQQLHSQIGRALEKPFPDIVATEPETLAHHFTEAGLTGSALGYWLKADQRAAARPAYPEALSHLERGLALVRALPESADRDRQELDYQIALSLPLLAARGYSSAEFGLRTNAQLTLYRSLIGQNTYCTITGKTRKALEFGHRLHARAMQQGDRVMQLVAHRATGSALLMLGQFVSARKELEQVLALHDPAHDRSLAAQFITDPFVTGSAYFAVALCISGYPEHAVKLQGQALNYASQLNHVNTSGLARLWAGTLLEQLLGNVPAVAAHAQTTIAHAAKYGLVTWRSYGTVMEGWAISRAQ
jgi:tetratricopeptide (TPR) repeat protein